VVNHRAVFFVYGIAGVNLRHASLYPENVNLYRKISNFF
jgi:hypothetical protein